MKMYESFEQILKTGLTRGMTPDQIAGLTGPLVQDSVWTYLGGSGARQQVVWIEGDVRAVFQFDGEDRLQAYALYRSKRSWVQAAEKGLPDPLSGEDVVLTLLFDR